MSTESLADRLEAWAGLIEDPDVVNNADLLRDAAAALRAIEQERDELNWVRMGNLTDTGIDWINEDEVTIPRDGAWVLFEIESATGISYQAEIYDRRSWPSFGVRWRYCEETQ